MLPRVRGQHIRFARKYTIHCFVSWGISDDVFLFFCHGSLHSTLRLLGFSSLVALLKYQPSWRHLLYGPTAGWGEKGVMSWSWQWELRTQAIILHDQKKDPPKKRIWWFYVILLVIFVHSIFQFNKHKIMYKVKKRKCPKKIILFHHV